MTMLSDSHQKHWFLDNMRVFSAFEVFLVTLCSVN